jgi:hypothetical protein
MSSVKTIEIRDYRPCWETSEIAQVIEGLERLSKRGANGKQTSQRRRCERKSYNAQVLVSQNRNVRLQDGSRAMLHLVARNLSRSGLGLLSPLFFEPEIAAQDAPMLRSTNIFRDGGVLEVGLRKHCGETLWVYGTVIRARTVQHDFLDVGIRFNARINAVEELDLE